MRIFFIFFALLIGLAGWGDNSFEAAVISLLLVISFTLLDIQDLLTKLSEVSDERHN